MTNAPSTPLSARSMAAESFQSPSTSSTPWFAQLDVFSRLRTSARISLPCANRCSAVAPPTFPVIPITLESRGFAHKFGSCGEAEVLHLVGILTFGDEFREDVVFGGIQEKFRQALA